MTHTVSDRPELPILDEARAAVAAAANSLTSLLRSGLDPGRRAVGHWTVGDVAAHLSHVFFFDAQSAAGRSSLDEAELPDFLIDRGVLPAIEEVRRFDDVNRINQAVLDQDPERRLPVLADRIDRSIEEIVRSLRSHDDAYSVPWLGGTRLPLVSVAGHVLFEASCHGFDVARAGARPWRIDPSHVRLIFDGFLGPFIEAAPDVMGNEHDGTTGCIHLRLRGQTQSYLVFDDAGTHFGRGKKQHADLHVLADPVTFLLVASGRVSRLRAILSAQMIAWGRHPLRGMRLISRLRSP